VLLEAFRRGLAAPALEMPALTPEVMELIGQLLSEAVRGTVDLLHARTTLKHELRAEVTTIVPRNNNPLKFSPNAEIALQHLLAPPARGFIAAAPAMRDAYDDLRAHQFAFVAGMQAVLEAALQRFDPVALEGRLGDPSLLHSLLPTARHARLWEMFTEHHARIRNEAADDFHGLFGKAFLGAYDEHVERLRKQRGAEPAEG
jgi:FHA domain-containing protein